MAVQASQLISLTISITGGAIKLSANKIVKFLASGANTLIGYIDNQDRYVQKLVTQSLATIDTAAQRTQAVTLLDGTVIYINSDNIIYLDDTAAGTDITYWNQGVAAPEIIRVSESPAAINTVAGNTFAVVTQTGAVTRYINNLFIGQVAPSGTGAQITYDSKRSAYEILYVVATPASVQTTVNAL
jgi:hypothetical protein